MSAPQYVYIIGDYDEYGTVNVRATLDRTKIASFIREFPNGRDEWKAEALTALEKLLVKSDEELAGDYGHELNDYWGGVLLYVVKLS